VAIHSFSFSKVLKMKNPIGLAEDDFEDTDDDDDKDEFDSATGDEDEW
jgi:hypothetical protein